MVWGFIRNSGQKVRRTSLLAHLDGFANISPTWKTPFVRKTPTLNRFHRLDAAHVETFEEDAFPRPAGSVDDAEARAIGIEASVLRREFRLAQPQVRRDARHLLIRDAHIARPAAAVAAALAEIACRGRFIAHRGTLSYERGK